MTRQIIAEVCDAREAKRRYNRPRKYDLLRSHGLNLQLTIFYTAGLKAIGATRSYVPAGP